MILPRDLKDFAGTWLLTRKILDNKAGQIVQADGRADLMPDANGLTYSEEVTVRVPGQPPMKGTRRYLWRSDADRISIYFDDGRYFHTLKLGETRVIDHHDCAPDSYDADYDFSGWPIWTVRWTVSGPRKSYEMETKYTLR